MSAVQWAKRNGLTSDPPDELITRGELLTILSEYNTALARTSKPIVSTASLRKSDEQGVRLFVGTASGNPLPSSVVDHGGQPASSYDYAQLVQDTGDEHCASNEFVAGLDTETISLLCEPVRVTYNEVTVTLTDADMPTERGESLTFGGSCPASHPVEVGGTIYFHSTGESGLLNRPDSLRRQPFFFTGGSGGSPPRLGFHSWSNYELGPDDPIPPPGHVPLVPYAFSTTVTFMTACWLIPSSVTSG